MVINLLQLNLRTIKTWAFSNLLRSLIPLALGAPPQPDYPIQCQYYLNLNGKKYLQGIIDTIGYYSSGCS